jgi:hypothetical protein
MGDSDGGTCYVPAELFPSVVFLALLIVAENPRFARH